MSDNESSSSDETIEPVSPTKVNVLEEEYDYVVNEKPKKTKKKKDKIKL